MSISVKQQIVGGIIFLMSVWPFVHFYLTQQFDINPWKLAGLAMFITPHKISVELYENADGMTQDILVLDLPEEVQALLLEFYQKRFVLGKLYPPAKLGASVLKARSKASSITVRVGVFQLDRRAADFRARWIAYLFKR